MIYQRLFRICARRLFCLLSNCVWGTDPIYGYQKLALRYLKGSSVHVL